ncbi:hypothetical protein [Streptomyces sp. XY332]|uniref:hypothetical protein n=1 Tax=Streptomyces sp. XY332 TaxID=1415561 RepID=UPI000B2E0676|nr:hypothetical protein [Streptomyces sp. XY332]
MERRATFGDTTAVISDGTTTYVFYTAESFKARNWPPDELVFRLDLAYDRVEAAEQHLLAARPGQPSPGHHPEAQPGPSSLQARFRSGQSAPSIGGALPAGLASAPAKITLSAFRAGCVSDREAFFVPWPALSFPPMCPPAWVHVSCRRMTTDSACGATRRSSFP